MKEGRRSAIVGESGYARKAFDGYMTQRWCLRALLRVVHPRGLIWEPAAGTGNLVEEMLDYGYDVFASDIHDHGPGYAAIDFLAASRTPAAGHDRTAIVTNPPYDNAEKFVRKALAMTKERGGSVSMLLRNEWDCAGSRLDLFRRSEFAAKVVLTRRPRWDDDNKASPRHNYAWFCWSWANTEPATILWPDCDDEIRPLGSGRIIL